MWEGWRSQCGSRLFYLEAPHCIRYFQSTIKSHINVSIVFNHIFSLQFTWGVPVLFSTWADCSCLWKDIHVNDDRTICWHQNRIKYQFNQRRLQNIYAQDIERDKSKWNPPLLNLMNVNKHIILTETVPSSKCENSRGWYAYSWVWWLKWYPA